MVFLLDDGVTNPASNFPATPAASKGARARVGSVASGDGS
jgi:hypothetical protein